MTGHRKKGRWLLLAVVGTAAAACGAGPGGCSSPALLPDGGTIPGCFCGNAAPSCFFEDGGVCAGEGYDAGSGVDGGPDGGADGGMDAGS